MASRTRSDFFWRSSSSSPASAPMRASNAARVAIQPTLGGGGSRDGSVTPTSASSPVPTGVASDPDAALGRGMPTEHYLLTQVL